MHFLLVGSSGLVGSHLLTQALADARVTQVTALVRRALPAHPKLQCVVVDFDALPEDAAWWQADAVLCTLGTTLRNAGSRAAFRRVDHDYPLAVAQLAHRHGTPTFVLNSAMGAHLTSAVFYNRVKGELEQALQAVGFRSLTLVRPGLIGGERAEFRLGERVLQVVLLALGPVLPRAWRINPAGRIAAAMLQAALDPAPGVQIFRSDTLT